MGDDTGMVMRMGALSMQVCVPKSWTDGQVIAFAEQENPCGTSAGWQIRRQGDPLLNGADERTPCSQDDERVHIMLDA